MCIRDSIKIGDYTIAPALPMFGSLAGMPIRKEIYDDVWGAIQAYDRLVKAGMRKTIGDWVYQTAETGNAYVKMMQVPLNIEAQARNVVTNYANAVFVAGVNPAGYLASIRNAGGQMVAYSKFKKGDKTITEKDFPDLYAAIQLGITPTTFHEQEIAHLERVMGQASSKMSPDASA